MEKFFIIASHGYFAKGLYDSLKLIMGEQKNIEVYCAYIDDSNVENKIADIIKRHKNHDLIVMTDFYGGSVNNFFFKYIKNLNFHLISNINLPFVMQMICSQNMSSEELINYVTGQNTNNVKLCKAGDLNNADGNGEF